MRRQAGRPGPAERYVFVDETKQQNYLIVAVPLLAKEVVRAQALVRSLRLPGQRGIHMHDESHARRLLIARTISDHGLTATIYNAGRRDTEQTRRRACLEALVAAHLDSRTHVVLDRDDSLVRRDRQHLLEITRRLKCRNVVTYGHGKYDERDSLLALPDAIAWCWARGGEWKRLMRPVVHVVRQVAP